MLTELPFARAAIAHAAFPCMCNGTHFAMQRISPERPLRGSKLGIPKPPFAARGSNNRVTDRAIVGKA